MRREALAKFSRRVSIVLAAICAASLVIEAKAGPDGECAARFHEALATIAARELPELAGVRLALTTADPTLPGSWMFFKREDRLKARLAARLSEGPLAQGDKVCAQATADRGGRVRCLKWVDKANAPARPATDVSATRDTPMTKSDLALISQLTRIVRTRGVLEEFDKNGRFFFLVSRTSDEIGDYLRQPLRPGLCSGATEMMGFYDTSFAPMRKRVDEFKRLAVTARSWVIREALRLEADEAKSAGADAGKTVPASTVANDKRAPAEILNAVARRHFDEAAASRIAAAPDLIAQLARFEDALISPEPPTAVAVPTPASPPANTAVTTVASNPGTAPAPKPSLVPFLRAVEAFAYADLASSKTRRLDDAYTSLMQGVIDAHTKTCTCGD